MSVTFKGKKEKLPEESFKSLIYYHSEKNFSTIILDFFQ